MKRTFLILFFSFVFDALNAQTDTFKHPSADTATFNHGVRALKAVKRNHLKDTTGTKERGDTLSHNAINGLPPDTFVQKNADTAQGIVQDFKTRNPIDSIYLKLLNIPFFHSKMRPVYLVINEKKSQSKDEMFYMLIGLFFFLALIKLGFSHYFANLFKQFVQPSFRQKQTREQLLQNNFPSLLLNLIFLISGGVFIALIMQYYNLSKADFKVNFAYSTLSLLVLYSGKFILLSFAGWVFNVRQATDTYIFIAFLVNKIMGIILLPFCFIIAFSQPPIITIGITLSLILVIVLFLYRYIAAIGPVGREMKMNISHFIFYVLAFEITPLLLIYKTLGIYLTKSA